MNGFVARDAEPATIAAAFAEAEAGGATLRASTARWFDEHADRLGASASARAIAAVYEAP